MSLLFFLKLFITSLAISAPTIPIIWHIMDTRGKTKWLRRIELFMLTLVWISVGGLLSVALIGLWIS